MAASSVKKARGSKSITHKNPQLPPTQIWPEWSDADINAEKWGFARSLWEKSKKGKGSEKSDMSDKSGKSGKTLGADSTKAEEQFEDPYEISLPWSYNKVNYMWKRPDVIFPQARLVVFSNQSPLMPDLVHLNRQLFISPFIRSVVSAVHMLMYIGNTRPFTIEWPTMQFQPNTEGKPWAPWHHIYSLCKAGKGQTHNPQSNTLGKYVVRLYFLGCWRKFIVDDTFPVDGNGKPWLPVSYIDDDTEMELWPALLTKALLKIASLTWTDKQEIVDFDVVTCLTGWAVQKIFTTGMDTLDIWEVFCEYSEHYTWDPRLILRPEKEEPVNLGEETGQSSKKSKSNKTSKGDKKTVEGPSNRSFHLTASCKDLRNLPENEIEDLTPCYEHDFLIEETRNIPLVNKIPEYDRNIAKWKEFRWIDWAVNQGLWDKVEEWEIFNCMRIVSSMRKSDDSQIYPIETSMAGQYIKNCVMTIDEFVSGKKQKEPVIEKDKKRKGPSKDSEKGSGSSKESAKKQKAEFRNPSFWSNFAKIAPYITCISVYLKPSSFKINYVISNIPFGESSDSKAKKTAKKDDKIRKSVGPDENSIRYLQYENVLMKFRNDAIYLFTDSVDFKQTMFSLSHLGNQLPGKIVKVEPVIKQDCKKLVCILNKCEDICTCQKISSEKLNVRKPFVDTRQSAHMIVEDFSWKSMRIGEIPISLKTYGNKSVLIDLEKGRHVKRIWLEASSPYVLLIFCDTEIKVGKVEEILDSMTEESELLQECCYSICSSFGRLIQFFGFKEYNVAIKQFYKSYIPNANLSKKQMALIHDAFQEELIKILAAQFTEDKYYSVSRAFRILLLNPNFRIPYKLELPKKDINFQIECMECYCDDIDGRKLRYNSATKIQSFFKMIYVRKLKSLHDPCDKKFVLILTVLKLVYLSIFTGKVRQVNIDLLRNLVINEKLGNLVQYFSFYKDLSLVISLNQFRGEVADISENAWVPIFRRRFMCETRNDIFIRAYITCSLPDYRLRIFNNDTGKEIPRHTNNALVCKYERNEKGYTVLAYGWTDKKPLKLMQWKVYIVFDKILNFCPVIFDNIKNNTTQFKGNYIPNKNNLICKFTVKIKNPCIATFHFKPSFSGASIKIQCLSKDGSILYEATGTSSVLIPVVYLSIIDDEQSASSIDLKQDDKSERSMSSSEQQSKIDVKGKSGQKQSKVKLTTKKRGTLKSMDRKSASSSPSKRKIKFSLQNVHETATQYILQAFVTENTWPLTLQEWNLTEKLKLRTSIGNEIKNILWSSKKQKERPNVSLKSANEKPNWILTCLSDIENNYEIQIDESRIEEIKNIKRNIFLNDFKRFLKGNELRTEFLENNYIKWLPESTNKSARDFSCQYNTLSEDYTKSMSVTDSSKCSFNSKSVTPTTSFGDERNICPECNPPQASEEFLYLKAPELVDKMLPPFEFNKFDIKDDKYRWLVTPEDQEQIFKDIINKMDYFTLKNEKYLWKEEQFIAKTKSTRQYLENWYKDIRNDSYAMMKEGENRRQNLLKKIKEEDNDPKKKTKEKK